MQMHSGACAAAASPCHAWVAQAAQKVDGIAEYPCLTTEDELQWQILWADQ